MEARTSAPPNHLAELYLPLGGENKNLETSFASIFLFHLTYNTQPSSITYPAVEEHLCLYYWWTMLRGRSLSSWEPKERNSEYLCHTGSCTQEHQEEVMVPHASIAVGLHGEDEGSIYWLPISVQRRLGKWQLSHLLKDSAVQVASQAGQSHANLLQVCPCRCSDKRKLPKPLSQILYQPVSTRHCHKALNGQTRFSLWNSGAISSVCLS